jgi:hypothetical protein
MSNHDEWRGKETVANAALIAAAKDLAAEVLRLREALSSIARNTCCGGCQEAALVAHAALGEAPDSAVSRACP